MARDRANIFTNIWTDTDWRALSGDEQHLYLLLMTHPDLSYSGVCDWRPGRLAKMRSDATKADIERIGRALQAKRFILIDEETEEVLIRSYIRHDGVLKQPNLSVSFVNAYGAAASPQIRMLIIHELKRLVHEFPEWSAFKNEKVMALLKEPSKSHAELVDNHANDHADNPSVEGGADPQVDPQPNPRDNRHTQPQLHPQLPPSFEGESEGNEEKSKETPLPKNWMPTKEHEKRARENNIDLMREAELFRQHALTYDRRAVRWNSAFTTWLMKAKPGTAPQQEQFNPNDPRNWHQTAPWMQKG
jgi:hypothetical protein